MKKGVYATVLVMAIGANAAVAMPHCGSRDDVVASLTYEYDKRTVHQD